MPATPSDPEFGPPEEATLLDEVDALRERARHQLETMRETMAEVDELSNRIERSD